MILDKKLQLASNLDIGNAARIKTGTRISNLLPAEGLMDLGNGEQLFCCVTVTESFAPSTGAIITGEGTGPSFFSFRLHHTYDFSPESFEADPGNNAITVAYAHRLQPLLGQTGYIPNKFGNFDAGKKFIFPISPVSHFSTLITGQESGIFESIPEQFVVGPFPVAGLAPWSPGSSLTYLYAVVEETGGDSASFTTAAVGGAGLPVTTNPVNQTASGRVDIDIVTISEPGAGPGFSDGYYYPVRAQVR